MTEGTYLADRVRMRCIEDADCWVWQGAVQGKSMPLMNNGGNIMAVRRALFLDLHGEVQKGCEVVGTCETRLCVNPEHIGQITVKTRRRLLAQKRNLQPVSAALIAKNRKLHAKLDLEKVRHIRACDERSDVLAELYGVSRTRINQVRSGSAWPDANPFAGLLQGARK